MDYFNDHTPIKHLYFFWKCLCFANGPVSVILRAYLPAIVQSITFSLGHDELEPAQSCTSGNSCFITLFDREIQYTSYVHYLRSVSTIIEIMVTLILTFFADTKWRFHIYFICVVVLSICSIGFFHVKTNDWESLWLASALYSIMMSVFASCESIQSSYIPVFMKHGIDGKKASSESMLLTNIGSITTLCMGILGTLNGSNLQTVTVLGGFTSFFAVFISSFYFWDDSDSESVSLSNDDDRKDTNQGLVEFFKDLGKYPEALALCIAWVLFTCSMTNFIVNLNLTFRSTTRIAGSDLLYSCFVFTSYVSATTSLFILGKYWFKNKSTSWIKYSYIITIVIAMYGTLGSTNRFIGLNHGFEFWLSDIIYIACSSAFRAILRYVYGELIPSGKESKFYSLEIIGGLIGTWFTGLLSGVIQSFTGDGRVCFVVSVLLSLASFWLFQRCDIEAGKKRTLLPLSLP